MNKLRLRDKQNYRLDPVREYLRNRMVPPEFGLVVQDLDAVVSDELPESGSREEIIRTYEWRFKATAEGRYLVVENKHQNTGMTKGQRHTFGLMHRIMRRGDPYRSHYIGWYLLKYSLDSNDCLNFPVILNDIFIMPEELSRRWLIGRMPYPSIFDEDAENLRSCQGVSMVGIEKWSQLDHKENPLTSCH